MQYMLIIELNQSISSVVASRSIEQTIEEVSDVDQYEFLSVFVSLKSDYYLLYFILLIIIMFLNKPERIRALTILAGGANIGLHNVH